MAVELVISSFVELPVRVKSKIVDAFQIHDRWTEEMALLKHPCTERGYSQTGG